MFDTLLFVGQGNQFDAENIKKAMSNDSDLQGALKLTESGGKVMVYLKQNNMTEETYNKLLKALPDKFVSEVKHYVDRFKLLGANSSGTVEKVNQAKRKREF